MPSFRDVLCHSRPTVKTFYLHRLEDESGVSGTGIVAVGVEFPSGRCVMEWVSKKTDAHSLGIYDDMDELKKIHGHDGKTRVEYA
jgi:hypothetical protein